MEDLTTGPLTRHLLKTTSFMLVTMVFQTLYFLIDLYWVGRLGTSAVAAVGIAGNMTFIVLALTQMLGVGTTTVVSHAVGRKNHAEAHLLFNQSQVLAMTTALVRTAQLILSGTRWLLCGRMARARVRNLRGPSSRRTWPDLLLTSPESSSALHPPPPTILISWRTCSRSIITTSITRSSWPTLAGTWSRLRRSARCQTAN